MSYLIYASSLICLPLIALTVMVKENGQVKVLRLIATSAVWLPLNDAHISKDLAMNKNPDVKKVVTRLHELADWIDKHSVNCYFCGKLFDEREGQNADPFNGNDGGDICPDCLKEKAPLKED